MIGRIYGSVTALHYITQLHLPSFEGVAILVSSLKGISKGVKYTEE